MSNVFDHPWLSGIFSDDEAIQIWSPDHQLKQMLAFEAALTRALGRVGIYPIEITDDIADRIATFPIDLENLRRGSATDGVPIPALVSQLRAMAGEHSDAVHTGATSQDVLDSALALTLRAFNALLHARLTALNEAIEDLSRRFGNRSLMGRTRMQAALPIAVSDRLRTWSQPLQTHLKRLDQLRGRVELLQLGGPVGNGTPLAPHTAEIAIKMAAELNLGSASGSWHATRDGLAEYANLLSLISGSVGKMGQDICLMAQQGVDESGLSGGGGSSAMPHKQNPVLAELLVTLARFNATQISGMHHALIHEQERSGAAWMLEWMILPEMAKATARSLSAATDLCAQINRLGAADPQ